MLRFGVASLLPRCPPLSPGQVGPEHGVPPVEPQHLSAASHSVLFNTTSGALLFMGMKGEAQVTALGANEVLGPGL